MSLIINTVNNFEKTWAIKQVSRDGLNLRKLKPELRDDEDVVQAAIAQSGCALAAASDRLKGMKAIVLQAIANWDSYFLHQFQLPSPFESAAAALRDDPDVVEAAFQQDPCSLKFASPNCVLKKVQEDGMNLLYASEEHRNDLQIVKAAVQNNNLAVRYASINCMIQLVQQGEEIPWYMFKCADRGLLLALVRKSPQVLTLEEAKELCKDREFALAAVNINGSALHHLPHFENDPEIGKAAYQNNPVSLMFAKRDASLEVVREDGLALEHVSASFQYDPEFSEAAFQNNPYALRFASRSFMLEKIRQHGRALRYLPEWYRDSSDLVRAAFENDPSSLQFASSQCVREVLSGNGLALQHASEAHRDDHTLVSVAVERNGLALEYASERLRANRDIVRIALQQNVAALPFASAELQANPPMPDPDVSAPDDDVSPEFIVDLEHLESHPVAVLRDLYLEMETSFPQIRYVDSPGVDADGLSRDFVTRLMRAIFDLDKKPLPMMEMEEKIFPLIEEGNPAQINAYTAIGTIFSYALQKKPAMVTGNYFHPLFFQMVHSLTLEEIVSMPDLQNYNAILEEVRNKLFTIYARQSLQFSEERVNLILQGNIPPDLQELGYETRENFFHSQFKQMALASVVISRSLCTHLQDPGHWDNIKGTPIDLAAKIEGNLTKEQVLGALEWNKEHETTETYLIQWLNECSFENLERFVLAITGSPTLIPGKKLKITLYPHSQNLPGYHTCFFRMDLPDGYPTYAIFKEKLEQSLSSIDGFQEA